MHVSAKIMAAAAIAIIGGSGMAQASGGKALTFVSKQYHDFDGPNLEPDWVVVGADNQSNAYDGDASPEAYLPILCYIETGADMPSDYTNAFQPYDAFYHGWSHGHVGLTTDFLVASITSEGMANEMCQQRFGSKARIAQFHDNQVGGWNFGAAIHPDTASVQALTMPGCMRFVVYINDQPANPWD